MIGTERTEFDSQMAILCAAFDVPCTVERREAYWIGLQQMPLSRFMHTIEFALRQEDWTRIPKPGQVWAISKRMRAQAPAKPIDDGFSGDVWDIQANLFLLSHIRQRLADKPNCYGHSASYKLLIAPAKDVRELGLDMKTLDAPSSFIGNVERLVAAKKAWAADMRDIAVKGEVPVELQQQVWREYLERAEAARA